MGFWAFTNVDGGRGKFRGKLAWEYVPSIGSVGIHIMYCQLYQELVGTGSKINNFQGAGGTRESSPNT